MKAQIEEILKENLSITQCGYMNSQADLDGVKDASEIIEQLMCYREAKAFLSAYKGDMWFFEVSCYLEDGGYSEPIILQAIEKVKSEQK